jgi:hypothetical protein
VLQKICRLAPLLREKWSGGDLEGGMEPWPPVRAARTYFLCLFDPQMLQPVRYQGEQWVDGVLPVASLTDFYHYEINRLVAYYFTDYILMCVSLRQTTWSPFVLVFSTC